ncbi:Ribosome maturation protein SDO1 [uncultured archaeon]|nr:Ribosome maturation protein SDO1 [uncultured archaeon]
MSVAGEKFEIYVDPNLALDFKLGKKKDFNNVMVVEEVFKDAKKADRVSGDKLKKAFGTEDILEVGKKIVLNGEVPITTEQKRHMIDEKRKKIIALLARETIDPRTNAPHPPQRIEKALEEVKIHVDPFKPAEQQIQEAITALRPVLPMKIETARLAVKVPADVAQKLYGSFKEYNVQQEEWQGDGSLIVVVEIPAGLQTEFFEKANRLTAGRAQIKDLKKDVKK